MLLLFSPGAAREDYFETLSDTARVGAMSSQQRAEFYLRHDNHWIPRPVLPGLTTSRRSRIPRAGRR